MARKLIVLHFHFPVLTILLIIGILLNFFILADTPSELLDQTMASVFAFNHPFDVWGGAYPALLFNNFVHLNWTHLIFSAVMIYLLGRPVELLLGRQLLFAVVFFAALFSQGTQLILTAQPTLGANGIIFALFGLLWGARNQVMQISILMPPRMMRFIASWLLLAMAIAAIPLAFPGVVVWPIGNAAHLGGLLFGVSVARVVYHDHGRWVGASGLGLLGVITILSVTWMPWNPMWRMWKAHEAFEASQYSAVNHWVGPMATEGENPHAMNLLAWTLATARDDSVREGERAVELARKANALTAWQIASYIDTLAAAYAELGRWEQAEAIQKLAIDLSDQPDSPEHGNQETFRENLQRIRNREKIRE